jgi:hypothetical protein
MGNPTIPSIRNCRITTLRNPPLSDTNAPHTARGDGGWPPANGEWLYGLAADPHLHIVDRGGSLDLHAVEAEVAEAEARIQRVGENLQGVEARLARQDAAGDAATDEGVVEVQGDFLQDGGHIRIVVAEFDLQLRVRDESWTVQPLQADQENVGQLVGDLFYWEGAVEVRDANGNTGAGYVELTGYGSSRRPGI